MDGSNALGRFLRGRRERVSPADVGLPTTGRRRVRGLRREEVAGLAGISPDYYLRIEQGRDVNPSVQVLESLAQALRLTSPEREHLLLLAGHRDESSAPDRVDAVPVGVSELLDAIEPLPAFAQNRFMDVLAANVSARKLSPAMRPGTNLIEQAFLNDGTRPSTRTGRLSPRTPSATFGASQDGTSTLHDFANSLRIFPSRTPTSVFKGSTSGSASWN